MDVIGYDDEAASEPMIPLRAVEQEGNEAFESGLVVQDVRAAIHTHRQEIGNVSIAIRPDALQTAQAARWWFVGGGNRDAV
jgi:hypothetical protein